VSIAKPVSYTDLLTKERLVACLICNGHLLSLWSKDSRDKVLDKFIEQNNKRIDEYFRESAD